MLKQSRPRAKNEKYFQSECSVASFIPYQSHFTSDSIIKKYGYDESHKS